jgi:hypothetical protein
MDLQPPLEPSQLVENTPEFTVWVLVVRRDISQALEAKEMAIA